MATIGRFERRGQRNESFEVRARGEKFVQQRQEAYEKVVLRIAPDHRHTVGQDGADELILELAGQTRQRTQDQRLRQISIVSIYNLLKKIKK